jgi:hypothetical protein
VRWSCISVWGGSSHQSETPILGVLSALLRNFYWHTVQVQLYGRAVVGPQRSRCLPAEMELLQPYGCSAGPAVMPAK